MNVRFQSLDAFRGLAAISVVIFHMHIMGGFTELEFFRGSSVFVEFFFILSGFVLTHGYGYKKEKDLFKFMKSRFFRIFPLHVVMLFVFVLLELIKLFASQYSGIVFADIPFTGEKSVAEILPNLLLIHSWVPFADHLSFNSPSWSISIEFYLYIVYILSITVFLRVKMAIYLVATVAAYYMIIVDSSLLSNEILHGLSCFFSGVLIYMVYRNIKHISLGKLAASVLEILAIVLTIIVVQSHALYDSVVADIVFFAVILIFSLESGVVSQFLKLGLFQYLGKLSYSIYMTHAAVLFCVTPIIIWYDNYAGIEVSTSIYGIPFLNFGSAISNNILALLLLCFIILLSHFTYHHIEMKWKK